MQLRELLEAVRGMNASEYSMSMTLKINKKITDYHLEQFIDSYGDFKIELDASGLYDLFKSPTLNPAIRPDIAINYTTKVIYVTLKYDTGLTVR